jgi:hypothetical protein
VVCAKECPSAGVQLLRDTLLFSQAHQQCGQLAAQCLHAQQQPVCTTDQQPQPMAQCMHSQQQLPVHATDKQPKPRHKHRRRAKHCKQVHEVRDRLGFCTATCKQDCYTWQWRVGVLCSCPGLYACWGTQLGQAAWALQAAYTQLTTSQHSLAPFNVFVAVLVVLVQCSLPFSCVSTIAISAPSFSAPFRGPASPQTLHAKSTSSTSTAHRYEGLLVRGRFIGGWGSMAGNAVDRDHVWQGPLTV